MHGSLGSAGESAGQKGYGQLGQATKGHLRPSGVEAAEPGRDRRWASCWCLPFSFPLSVLGESSSFSFSYMVFLFFFFFLEEQKGFLLFYFVFSPVPYAESFRVFAASCDCVQERYCTSFRTHAGGPEVASLGAQAGAEGNTSVALIGFCRLALCKYECPFPHSLAKRRCSQMLGFLPT